MTRIAPPTIADLRAAKGKRQYSMLRVETVDEALAAAAAGIDMLSLPPTLLTPDLRAAIPQCFLIPGLEYGDYVNADEYLRAAFKVIKAGADAVYCAASSDIIKRLRAEGIPVCGHCGLIPSQATWTGGFHAVGKTLESALLVWQQLERLEEAGAFAAEIEVVPAALAAEISRRTSLFLISMGSGSQCDAQYLFACDVLGANRGHVPRHAKVYQNFAAEADRLQQLRIEAFSDYRRDVASGAYPEPQHLVPLAPAVLEQFLEWINAA